MIRERDGECEGRDGQQHCRAGAPVAGEYDREHGEHGTREAWHAVAESVSHEVVEEGSRLVDRALATRARRVDRARRTRALAQQLDRGQELGSREQAARAGAQDDRQQRRDRKPARSPRREQQRRGPRDRRRENRHHECVRPAGENHRGEHEGQGRRASRAGPLHRVLHSEQQAGHPRRGVEHRWRPHAAPEWEGSGVEEPSRDASQRAGAEAAREQARQRRRQRHVRERQPYEGPLRRQRQVQPVGRIQHPGLQRREEGSAESLGRIPQRKIALAQARERVLGVGPVVREEVVDVGRALAFELDVEGLRRGREPDHRGQQRRDDEQEDRPRSLHSASRARRAGPVLRFPSSRT